MQTGAVESPAEPLINLHIGDTYRYRWDGPTGSTAPNIELGAARMVMDGNGNRVLASPVLIDGAGPQTIVPFLSLSDGSLVISASACLVVGPPCKEGPVILWPACPLMGSVFSPFASMGRSEIREQRLVVRDPNRGYEWTYNVAREGSNLHLTLEPDSLHWQRCQLPSAAKIDLDRGLLLEVELGGTRGVLESHSRGTVQIGLARSTPTPVMLGASPLIDSLPPGAAELTSEDLTLGDAWAAAKRDSADVKDFLRQHPEAVIANALRSRGKVELLGVQTAQTAGWALTLLAPTGETMGIQIVRTHSPPWPDEYRFVPDSADPGSDAPTQFHAVEQLRDLGEVIAWLDRTLGPAAKPPHFFIEAVPGGASYSYASDFSLGAAGVSGWALYDAGSGRLVQLNVESGTPTAIIGRPD